jgi:NitT/TauT family transport system substrate-binding protein
MVSRLCATALVASLALAAPAAAQQTKVVLAMSGWTGFAPFTLAKEKNLFAKHGVDFEIKKMPTQARHAAMAAGEVQAIATTIDTHITYVAAHVPVTQVLVIDSSTGGDGVLVKKASGASPTSRVRRSRSTTPAPSRISGSPISCASTACR